MLEKITKPKDCLLAIAIPLTECDFYNDLKDGTNKDFAKSRKNIYNFNEKQLWKNDHLPLANLIKQISADLTKMGAKVVFNFKSSEFPEICSYQVFTLIAHSIEDGEKIELYDGLISSKKFVELLPEKFKGILDMTICNSTLLQTKIKKKLGNIVIANRDKTSVHFRLLFYKNLIRYLSVNNMNYIDAFANLRIQLIKEKI